MPTSGVLADLLDEALATGDDGPLRAILVTDPGSAVLFARAVGAVIVLPDPPVAALEALLDGWAAILARDAPADGPGLVLPCAAMAAYGEAAIVRPDWFDDEIAKLRRAAADPRRPVRDAVVDSLRRMLDADRRHTAAVLVDWAGDADPLVARVATTALAGRAR